MLVPEAGFDHGGEGVGGAVKATKGSQPASPSGGRILSPLKTRRRQHMTARNRNKTSDLRREALMPSAVDCGLQLYFIVTKIVTSLLSGVVLDGCQESLKGLLLS